MRRNCHAIGMANLAQMVNVIAPIFTSPEGMFLQTIYHPLRLAAEKSGSTALDVHVECDTYEADYIGLPEVRYLDAFATLDESEKNLYVSLVNLNKDEPADVELLLQEAEVTGGRAHIVTGDAPDAYNDFGQERVTCRTEDISDTGSRLSYQLPAHAHAVLELALR
jgi:alpha-N-arabinofuranosidase